MFRTRTRRVRHITHRAGLSAIPFESLESRVLLSTIYVDASAPGVTQDGMSWGTAYRDLQLALAVATAGDEVRVADGVYKPTSGTDQNVAFRPQAGVTIKGGYAGYGEASPDTRDLAVFATTLSGDIGVVGDTSDNSRKLVELVANCTIDGLNATSGVSAPTQGVIAVYGDSAIIVDCGFNGNVGTAIAVHSEAPAMIRRCSFVATSIGIENLGGSATIEDCIFSGLGTAIRNINVTASRIRRCNFAGSGTAIYSQRSIANASEFVEDCTFTGHTGTVIRNLQNRTYITRCHFVGNEAINIQNQEYAIASIADCTFVGGTIGLDLSPRFFSSPAWSGASVWNSTFVGFRTTAISSAGGTSLGSPIIYYRSGVNVFNCTFVDNVRGISPSISTVDVNNSIFWNNAIISAGQIPTFSGPSSTIINVAHSNIQGGYAGTGNINADPQFVQNPQPGSDGVYGTSDDDLGNLRLRSTSPSLDAGSNAAVPSDITTDLDGLPRIVDVPGGIGSGAIVDMGAYERPVDAGNLTIISWAIDIDALQPMARVTFHSPILPSTLGMFDLQIRSILSSGGLGEAMFPGSFTYDAPARQVSFVLPTNLADGNYRATFQANSVSNGYINAPGSATDHDFFLLSGDANRDRKVDLKDLMILAANWMGSGKVFTQGDFNRDGIVNAVDLGILSMKWQSRMDAPLPSPPIPTSPVRSPIRTPTRLMALL